MSIKRILVPLPGQTDYSGEIDMALSGAKALGAHIEALLITQPSPPRSSSISYGRNSLPAEAVNIAADEQEQRGRVARERFAAACMTHGVPLLAADEAPSVLPSAYWHEIEGSYLAVAVTRWSCPQPVEAGISPKQERERCPTGTKSCTDGGSRRA